MVKQQPPKQKKTQAPAKTINQEFNAIFKPVFFTEARYIHFWGGRARGGSHTVTEYFLFLITQPKYFRGTFLRAIFGDIRGSLWQDFKDRVADLAEKGEVLEEDFKFNEGPMTVTYLPTGNTIISKGFKKSSGSSSAKLKSLAGMTHVAIEEAEEVAEEDFLKLDDSLRTAKVERIQVILLFNPPSKNHWLMKRYYNLVPSEYKGWYSAVPKQFPEFLSIHSNYVDNIANLNESTIKKYRSYGDPNSPMYNEDFYYRDVKGLVSEGKKGRIFTKVYPITNELFDALPYESFYGLDWGFSEDPVSLTEIKAHNKKAYLRQTIYEPGLTDDDLAEKMSLLGVGKRKEIIADSAEPKSITTISRKGYNILPADAKHILNRIKYLQSFDLYVTEGSSDIWLEAENYTWALDREKNPTDTPIDKWNHAWDGVGYALVKKTQNGGNTGGVTVGTAGGEKLNRIAKEDRRDRE